MGPPLSAHRPRRCIGVIALVAGLLAPPQAEANLLCTWFGRCLYESPGFQITVVDKETSQPLADVHALAVWLNYGQWGTRGPLIALDTISGLDGILSFPRWGPLRGSRSGLVLARDPAISLFKPGYQAFLIHNAGPSDKTDTTRVRPFGQAGQIFSLEPFKGTVEDWIAQLREAAFPPEIGTVSQYAPQCIREVYVGRMRRVKAEADRLALTQKEAERLLWSIESSLKLLSVGGNVP